MTWLRSWLLTKNDEWVLSVKLVYWVGFVAIRYTFPRFFFWSTPNCSNAVPTQILGQDLNRNLPQVWLRLLSQYVFTFTISQSKKKSAVHSFVVNFSAMQTLYDVFSFTFFSCQGRGRESDILKVSNSCLKESLSSKNSEVN